MEFITKSSQETYELGEKTGSELKGGEIIALYGELGAGKTTFIQGLAKGLSIQQTITSPTFIIMRSYEIPEKHFSSPKTFYHVDLYRLEENVISEITNMGITDLWNKGDSIFVIEWADRLDKLPPETKKISIEILPDDYRKITI